MPKRLAAALRSFLSRLAVDRSGVSAVFLAVSLIPTIGAVGLAVDSSLGYLLKARMTKALDAAGLAAGRNALDADAEDVAEQFFTANFGALGDVELRSFHFELDETEHFITLTADARMPTYFMRVFGQNEMVVNARTVVERQTTGMELALVLDNTGSMYGANFTAMYNASKDLIQILYGDETEKENLWVGLVPYTATVNIGTSHKSWLLANDRVNKTPTDYSPDTWKGCVMARAYPRDTNDDTPSDQKWTSFFYASTTRTQDNKWPPLVTTQSDLNKGNGSDTNKARGPNVGCPSAITPLTSSRTTIDAALDRMGPVHRGGTAGNLGLSWGWRVLSPRWRGLWGDADHPLDYASEADEGEVAGFIQKVAVVLTDGENTFYDNDTGAAPGSDYTAYGRIEALTAQVPGKTGKEILDSRMAGTCEAMKQKGIRIYTILFKDTNSAAIKKLWTDCASFPSYYYYAPNRAALTAAFRSIGGQLANLMIVE